LERNSFKILCPFLKVRNISNFFLTALLHPKSGEGAKREMGVMTSSSSSSPKNATGAMLELTSNESISLLTNYTGKFDKITITCNSLTDHTRIPLRFSELKCSARILDLSRASVTQAKLFFGLLDSRAPRAVLFDQCIFSLKLFVGLVADFVEMLEGFDGFEPLTIRTTKLHLYGFEIFLKLNNPADLILFQSDFEKLFMHTRVYLHVSDSTLVDVIGQTIIRHDIERKPKIRLHSTHSISGLRVSELNVEQLVIRKIIDG
jgi:hypothetical protein